MILLSGGGSDPNITDFSRLVFFSFEDSGNHCGTRIGISFVALIQVWVGIKVEQRQCMPGSFLREIETRIGDKMVTSEEKHRRVMMIMMASELSDVFP